MKKQGLFEDPENIESNDAVFNLIWTYLVEVLDNQKKAQCTCDRLSRAGQVQIFDHTYSNCGDKMSSGLLYAAAALENLAIFGADVLNTSGEAPPPRKGFYIRPDLTVVDV